MHNLAYKLEPTVNIKVPMYKPQMVQPQESDSEYFQHMWNWCELPAHPCI